MRRVTSRITRKKTTSLGHSDNKSPGLASSHLARRQSSGTGIFTDLQGRQPIVGSQSRTVRSWEPNASSRLSNEKVTEYTELEWLSKVCCKAPDARFQSRMVLSSEPDAISRPSGEKTTGLVILTLLLGSHVVSLKRQNVAQKSRA